MNVMFGAKVMATTCVCVGIVILRTNTGSSLHAWLICIVFMYTLCITNACMHTPIRVYVAERERIGYERL